MTYGLHFAIRYYNFWLIDKITYMDMKIDGSYVVSKMSQRLSSWLQSSVSKEGVPMRVTMGPTLNFLNYTIFRSTKVYISRNTSGFSHFWSLFVPSAGPNMGLTADSSKKCEFRELTVKFRKIWIFSQRRIDRPMSRPVSDLKRYRKRPIHAMCKKS